MRSYVLPDDVYDRIYKAKGRRVDDYLFHVYNLKLIEYHYPEEYDLEDPEIYDPDCQTYLVINEKLFIMFALEWL